MPVFLVVDDTQIMRLIMKDILVKYCKMDGNYIQEANGGVEAVRAYRRLMPSLVFLDISMPDLDGIETVKQIMQIDKNANIIMCTSSNDELDVVDCIRAGAKDYIKKPPDPNRVVKAVETILDIKIEDLEDDDE